MDFAIRSYIKRLQSPIKADKTYIQETSDAPYATENTVRFKNPVLNVLFGSWSTEYNIYIPEGSFIQDGYGISLE